MLLASFAAALAAALDRTNTQTILKCAELALFVRSSRRHHQSHPLVPYRRAPPTRVGLCRHCNILACHLSSLLTTLQRMCSPIASMLSMVVPKRSQHVGLGQVEYASEGDQFGVYP